MDLNTNTVIPRIYNSPIFDNDLKLTYQKGSDIVQSLFRFDL